MQRREPTNKPTHASRGAAFLAGFESAIAAAHPEPPPSLEEFVTSPEYCNFNASDVQRGLIRALDGLPPGLSPSQMRFHFGAAGFAPGGRPKLAVLECGVRAGKSLIAALCANLYCALYADLSVARPDELIKSFIVAPRLLQARGTFRHAMGTLRNSPKLAKHLKSANKESMIVERSDGREVEILLVAASPEGKNLRSTWVTGAVFSEADFFDSEDSAVNLTDNYEAVGPRLVPGGQMIAESSPWADEGPYHKLVVDHFGQPDAEKGIIVFHSDSRSMFPGLDRAAEAKMRATDPDKAAREYDAIPLSTSGTEFFPIAAVRQCVNAEREIHLPPKPNVPHWGGSDLGFMKNSSAVAFARYEDGRVRLAFYEELRPKPGEPLKPSVVISSFATTGLSYHASSIRGDGHYAAAALEEFPKHTVQRGGRTDDITYDGWDASQSNQAIAFGEFKRLMLEGRLELPDDPRLRLQIEKTKSRVLPGGRVQIVHSKQGHAHGDVLMAVVLACVQVPTHDPVPTDTWSSPIVDSRWGGNEGRGFG
jgi:hypothetical protein